MSGGLEAHSIILFGKSWLSLDLCAAARPAQPKPDHPLLQPPPPASDIETALPAHLGLQTQLPALLDLR